MLFKIILFMVPLLALLYVTVSMPSFAQAQLASVLEQQQSIDVSQYLISEKFDGVRAIWNGNALITRQGNPIHAPAWFTAALPNRWLDGELWIGHQQFEAVSAIVRTHIPDDVKWRQVRYMIFDAPDLALPFAERYTAYQVLIANIQQASALEQTESSHIQAVEQLRFHQRDELDSYLAARIEAGAEGLMLHQASAFHRIGRIVTYKYHGYTNSGLPRFTSFLRVRGD